MGTNFAPIYATLVPGYQEKKNFMIFSEDKYSPQTPPPSHPPNLGVSLKKKNVETVFKWLFLLMKGDTKELEKLHGIMNSFTHLLILHQDAVKRLCPFSIFV